MVISSEVYLSYCQRVIRRGINELKNDDVCNPRCNYWRVLEGMRKFVVSSRNRDYIGVSAGSL
jgi:hypothetical protein